MEEIDWRPRYVTLGPGGVRGFYMLGALSRLKSSGLLDGVTGYSGSSVGAMISLLMVAGYEPVEITSIAADTSLFADFFSARLGEKLMEIKENVGLISNDSIRTTLERVIRAKYGHVVTLGELHHLTGKELYIVTYNLTLGRTDYISHLNHPDLSVVAAVLLSISIPFLFYQSMLHGHVCLDGGLTDPMPIRPFATRQERVLAIYVRTTIVERDDDSEIARLTKRIQKIIMAPMAELRDRTIRGAGSNVTFIGLDSHTLDTTGSTATVGDRAQMFIEGQRIAGLFLTQVKWVGPGSEGSRTRSQVVIPSDDTPLHDTPPVVDIED